MSSTARLAVVLLMLGCDGPRLPDAGVDAEVSTRLANGFCAAWPCPEDRARDVRDVSLEIDLEALRGVAEVTFSGAPVPGARLAIGDLEIEEVTRDGLSLEIVDLGPRLVLNIPPSRVPVTVRIRYRFLAQDTFEGWNPGSRATFLWPTHCQNLYPCVPEPADGMTFSLAVRGVPDGLTAVLPERIASDAPSYMPAIAVGDYRYERIGTTAGGVEVGFYATQTGREGMRRGTESLTRYLTYFEQRLGPYRFGDRVAAVEVRWGPGRFGVEHHPFWHVNRFGRSWPVVHAIQAAHGWFGNGVRIACWEDGVLSEGTATYLGARAIEAIDGLEAGRVAWDSNLSRLRGAVAFADTVALPDGCNEVDLTRDPLRGDIPETKGAFFLRAVESRVGRPAMDAALRSFYSQWQGRAARMMDLVAHIERNTNSDLSDLVQSWLRGLGIPR